MWAAEERTVDSAQPVSDSWKPQWLLHSLTCRFQVVTVACHTRATWNPISNSLLHFLGLLWILVRIYGAEPPKGTIYKWGLRPVESKIHP